MGLTDVEHSIQCHVRMHFCFSCTDVNPAAAQCTAETASCNRVSLQPLITDLVIVTCSYGLGFSKPAYLNVVPPAG